MREPQMTTGPVKPLVKKDIIYIHQLEGEKACAHAHWYCDECGCEELINHLWGAKIPVCGLSEHRPEHDGRILRVIRAPSKTHPRRFMRPLHL